MDLVDIGINLAHKSYTSDRAAVILRAREAGVRRMGITGTSAPGRSPRASTRRSSP